MCRRIRNRQSKFLFYLGESVDVEENVITHTEWNIAPNPTSNNITSSLPNDKDLISLRLYNSVGSKLADLPLPAGNEIFIPVGYLQNGLYYISYQSDKETRSKSFVKVD